MLHYSMLLHSLYRDQNPDGDDAIFLRSVSEIKYSSSTASKKKIDNSFTACLVRCFKWLSLR